MTATISHVVLPNSLVPSLWQAVADAHAGLADYGLALFGAGDTAPVRTKLLGHAIEMFLWSAAFFYQLCNGIRISPWLDQD